jgi:hypothetical protein
MFRGRGDLLRCFEVIAVDSVHSGDNAENQPTVLLQAHTYVQELGALAGKRLAESSVSIQINLTSPQRACQASQAAETRRHVRQTSTTEDPKP